MAKNETPAEIPGPARPLRPAPGIPQNGGASPARSVASSAEAASAMGAARLWREGNEAPGLAKARARRSELASEFADTTRSTMAELLDPELIGEDDILDVDELSESELFARSRPPRLGGAKVPVATLEPPSPTRLELTPSPVPRVQLEPATGTVDVSLVPGPNALSSRNLPTLAAQHAFGRRAPAARDAAPRDQRQGAPKEAHPGQHHPGQHHPGQREPARAAAPAMTLPPTEATAREVRAAVNGFRDVRSSKREVVLGLGIGLGLSMVLAAIGQSYLRDEVVAERLGIGGSRQPGGIESVTLSARADSTAGPGAPSAMSSSGTSSPGTSSPGTSSSSSSAMPQRAAVSSGASQATSSTRPAAGGSAGAGREGRADVATRDPRLSGRSELGTSGRSGARPSQLDERRLDGKRVERTARAPARERERERRSAGVATEPPAFDVEKPFPEPPAPERAPLSPAQSAGLGLDLPL